MKWPHTVVINARGNVIIINITKLIDSGGSKAFTVYEQVRIQTKWAGYTWIATAFCGDDLQLLH